MNVNAQIKYWIFGTTIAVAVYLIIHGGWGNSEIAIGLALAAAGIGLWDHARDAEKAATYERMRRDELARQYYVETAAKG